MLNIPEIQLLSVIVLGFVIGAFFLDYFFKRPVLFSLVSGIAFFGVRYAVALTGFDVLNTGIIGNGILSALVMWVVYVACMMLGRYVTLRRWEVDEEDKTVPLPSYLTEPEEDDIIDVLSGSSSG